MRLYLVADDGTILADLPDVSREMLAHPVQRIGALKALVRGADRTLGDPRAPRRDQAPEPPLR
jgi:hypothetical protein